MQYDCDINSLLGPFTITLAASELQNSTLRTHIRCSAVDLKMQSMCILSSRSTNMPMNSKSPDILSFRSIVKSKGGTFLRFLRHPV